MLDLNPEEIIDRLQKLMNDCESEASVSRSPYFNGYEVAIGRCIDVIKDMAREKDRQVDEWYRQAVLNNEITQ
jgi:hypothetical protein